MEWYRQGKTEDECGAMVEWYRQGKTEVVGEKTAGVSLIHHKSHMD